MVFAGSHFFVRTFLQVVHYYEFKLNFNYSYVLKKLFSSRIRSETTGRQIDEDHSRQVWGENIEIVLDRAAYLKAGIVTLVETCKRIFFQIGRYCKLHAPRASDRVN